MPLFDKYITSGWFLYLLGHALALDKKQKRGLV